MRTRTKDRAKQERQYNKRVKQWKRENAHCKACEALQPFHKRSVIKLTSDCHHRMGKEGDLLLDERYWLPVCRWCHDFIEEHGRLARELGFVLDKDYRNDQGRTARAAH